MVLYMGESIPMRGCCPFSVNQTNTMWLIHVDQVDTNMSWRSSDEKATS